MLRAQSLKHDWFMVARTTYMILLVRPTELGPSTDRLYQITYLGPKSIYYTASWILFDYSLVVFFVSSSV